MRSPGTVDVPRIVRVLRRQGRVLGAAATLNLTTRIRDHVDGLGALQELVAPGVTDLLVNDDGTVWVDDADGLHPTAHRLRPGQARDLAVRLATVGGRRLDDAMPWADAHLPSGIRFHAVLPPLSPGGTILSLRLPAARHLGLQDLRAARGPGSRRPRDAAAMSRRSVPILVAGGAGREINDPAGRRRCSGRSRP